MDKLQQTQILKLELLRLKVIVNELTKSSNKDLSPEELVVYIENLNRLMNLNTQINKSFTLSQKRAEAALKTARSIAEKSQLAADPDFLNLQEKLDFLYKKALESQNSTAKEEKPSQND